MKTPPRQGFSIFPGGSSAKASLVWGQAGLSLLLVWVGTPGLGAPREQGEPALLPADTVQMLWLRRLWRGR